MERDITGLWRYVRRRLYCTFRKGYVEESLMKRKGTCQMHGCCHVAFIPCKHYNREQGKCVLWRDGGFEAMPYYCQIYPFDEKDKTKLSRKICDFHWDEK
jgi:hypothetical protein